MDKQATLEKITALAKRRGFIYPSSEIYGGLANVYDFGPLGVELKNNIKNLWWRRFVHQRDDMVGLDAAILMNPKIWEASGHIDSFYDLLVECRTCHQRIRLDQLEGLACPSGNKHNIKEVKPRKFTGMFKTKIGATAEDGQDAYLRPETAQAIFVNFKNILETSRKKIPFGVAQIGKAFRNEITTGYFIFRTLEFEQMEIEYFIKEDDWEAVFENWKKEMMQWAIAVGIKQENLRFREHDERERSHYSKRTVDVEYNFEGNFKEIFGLAYRGDYDLIAHQKHSGVDLKYIDPVTNKKFTPHVIEPSFGLERTILPILLDAYFEDEKRVVLKLKPNIAPYKVAIFPLVHNKQKIIEKAKQIFNIIKESGIVAAWDDRGNIGKRYLSQDEIGTPFCVTIDYQTLEDDTVTVRNRDTMIQERMSITHLNTFLK